MGNQGEGGHTPLCPAGTGGMRGETSLLQAQLALGPVDSGQRLPAPHSNDPRHARMLSLADAQEHVGSLSDLDGRWNTSPGPGLQGSPCEGRELVGSLAPGPR